MQCISNAYCQSIHFNIESTENGTRSQGQRQSLLCRKFKQAGPCLTIVFYNLLDCFAKFPNIYLTTFFVVSHVEKL